MSDAGGRGALRVPAPALTLGLWVVAPVRKSPALTLGAVVGGPRRAGIFGDAPVHAALWNRNAPGGTRLAIAGLAEGSGSWRRPHP
jgi:hypothetical protein